MNPLGQAQWIWLPAFQDSDAELPGKFVLFRKTFHIGSVPKELCEVKVSADTRYRLYVNGQSVVIGPCKSYPTRTYYETVDIAPFLHAGDNVIAAKVLRFFPGQIGSSSMMKANVPGFILAGAIGEQDISTNETWLCCEDGSIRLQTRSEWNYILGPPFLSLDEDVDASKAVVDWRNQETQFGAWTAAVPAVKPIKMMPALEPWKLHARPIPLLTETPCNFQGALKCTGTPTLQEWNNLLTLKETLTIEANQEAVVEFESSVLTTGFLEFDFSSGNEADVTILYAEAYEKDQQVSTSPFPRPRYKGDRRDYKNGRLYGMHDHVKLSAAKDEKTLYEPFWFRTFRFIRLSIMTKDAPLSIQRISFRETLYPLEISTSISIPSELQPIWTICLETLRKCMHDTYEDCPYYEQNQFAMDARLQMLFTYQLCRDDRLARKTIHEFYASRREDGLIETNFPVSFRAINIPQFSLFWIMMLYDHMMYFDDAKLIRKYIGAADSILDYFDAQLNDDGLVAAFDPECWAFIDWVKEWHGTKGIRDMATPPIYKKTGVAAYNSLLYAWILQHAADLCSHINRHDTAKEYRARADDLNAAVNLFCFNGTFYLDGPNAAEICEHTQIFAVLSGAITGQAAKDLMHRTMTHESMPRCSYAMKHYVFRALSKTGLYAEYFSTMMKPWHAMVANNSTTCPEDDVGFRSDCHGWSASPIYEIIAELHGIRPAKPGFAAVALNPRKQLLPSAEVRYCLPRGELNASWVEGKDGMEFESSVDSKVQVWNWDQTGTKVLTLRGGQKRVLGGLGSKPNGTCEY